MAPSNFSPLAQSLVAKGLKADEWMKAVSDVTGGKGGGNNSGAQASSPNINKLQEAMGVAREFAKLKLE